MKKRTKKSALAAALAATAMLAAVPIYAADKQNATLNLSISKDSVYMLTIPESPQAVDFGTENTSIGNVAISGTIGTLQKVRVTATKEVFKDEKDASNTIPFSLKNGDKEFISEDWVRTDIKSTPEASKNIGLTVNISADTWANAAPGKYNGKIIFGAELLDS